jgi:hypothetical protein
LGSLLSRPTPKDIKTLIITSLRSEEETFQVMEHL